MHVLYLRMEQNWGNYEEYVTALTEYKKRLTLRVAYNFRIISLLFPNSNLHLFSWPSLHQSKYSVK